MKVADAGVVVELLAGRLDVARLGDEELAAPHLLDSEVTQVLYGLTRRQVLDERQADAAFGAFLRLSLTRFAADWLRPRIWELRHNLTAYDATYVALAEQTGSSSLLTTDARLARAPGPTCSIELLG